MNPVVPVVVVHGGAGDVPLERRPAHVAGCRTAAAAGLEILVGGGSSLEACVRAVEIMEDDAQYNAGTGGSLTEMGTLELDAGVMDGATLAAGAVCALPAFENPIRIAHAVLIDGRHVLYAAEGAAAFAERAGFVRADPAEMITERARHQLDKRLAGRAGEGWAGGTVGAVACDERGHVAAATSTGGTVGKASGRVGDTPILGAGTYADDAAGACSATGIGETIMRACLAHTAVELCRALPAPEAAARAMEHFRRFDGRGGLIVVDRRGRVAHLFNTDTMSHAVARVGEPVTSGP
jgi:beta-aspartyl-peptidase (threonine type)